MHPSICLAMIVKNDKGSDEFNIIRRCLDSCVGLVDDVVIIATSKDLSKQGRVLTEVRHWAISKNIDVFGFCYKWDSNFGKARNAALQKAKETLCEWILWLDADEWIKGDHQIIFNALRKTKFDAIALPMVMADGKVNPRISLMRDVSGWEWMYKIHESLMFNGKGPSVELIGDFAKPTEGPYIGTSQDGARSKDPERLAKDIETLKSAFEETGDFRYLFYQAETEVSRVRFVSEMKVEDDIVETIGHFNKFIDESATTQKGLIYRSYLQIGRLYLIMMNSQAGLVALLNAYHVCPERTEALGEIALLYANQRAWAMTKIYALACTHAPKPNPNAMEFFELDWMKWKGPLTLIESMIELQQFESAQQYLDMLPTYFTVPEAASELVKSLAERIMKGVA